MNTLPIYNAVIEDEMDGIIAISLVDYPAVESNFICFSKNNKPQIFSIENEEEHIITGVLMLCDTPIYRCDGSGYEYYINFTKETIKQMSIKLLKDGSFKNIDFQHNGELLPQGKIEMIELFIKNDSKGISPNFVENIPDGSLMVSFKVNDNDIWNECKNGDFLNGFSLEGFFDVEEKKFNNNKKNNIFNMSKIKDLFKKLLTAFGAVTTVEGILHYDGDEDLKAGMEVYGEDGELAKDGEYHTEDGKTIKVENGVVVEIVDVKAEVDDDEDEVKEEMEETTDVTEPVAEPEVDEIAEIKKEIEDLKKAIEEIKEILKEPVAEPVEETFNAAAKKTNKYQRLGEAMRNL